MNVEEPEPEPKLSYPEFEPENMQEPDGTWIVYEPGREDRKIESDTAIPMEQWA